MIVARSLTKSYGTGPTAVVALAGASFDIGAGERVAVLGKSGSGKSTMLNLLGGLDRPTSGSLAFDGADLATMTRGQLADYRLSNVGFVFQSFHLLPSDTVRQNVELPLMLAGVSPAERKARATATLDAVGLSHRLTHRPTELSGGERQRVALARSLVNRPRVLLADEPTGNLDSATATVVMRLILDQVRERGMTLILVTHDEELAKRTTDRFIRMADGRIVFGERPV
jgi:ABC-type lipoprotein export system ATPase subunit